MHVIFTIQQKKVDHESSIYKGAKMPYMQRLTWDGIAMHAGRLPGYPASHGCVRLPVDFAEKLYAVTTEGTTVIVTDQKHAPGKTANPGLLLNGKTGTGTSGPLPSSGFEWQPMKATNGAVAVIFSVSDSVAYDYRNGVQIGRSSFVLNRKSAIKGSHVYSALG
ncbi:MAG: L,D-transpeptidase family protein [Verrucomicrobiia bacterium]